MIYYPHYTPSKSKFRSILLFWDDVNLIVPRVDQEAVQNRSNISDLYRVNPSLITFRDPQFRYDGWAIENGVGDFIERIIDEISNQTPEIRGPIIRVDHDGYVIGDQRDAIRNLSKGHGWTYVAAQKFPQKIQDAIFQSQVAARVGVYRNPKTGQIVENEGVICHPKIASFVLTRMARQASFIEGLPSITFGGLNFMDHLFDGAFNAQPSENVLLQYSLDLFAPDNLTDFSASDFLKVKQEYEGVSREFKSYIRDISSEKNLTIVQSSDAFLQNVTRAREAIKKEFDAAQKAIGQKRFFENTALSIETVSTLGAGALGALLNNPLGAMIASGIGLAGGKFASRLSTVNNAPDGRLMSVAMSKAKVERRGIQQPWDAPAHWRLP